MCEILLVVWSTLSDVTFKSWDPFRFETVISVIHKKLLVLKHTMTPKICSQYLYWGYPIGTLLSLIWIPNWEHCCPYCGYPIGNIDGNTQSRTLISLLWIPNREYCSLLGEKRWAILGRNDIMNISNDNINDVISSTLCVGGIINVIFV